MHKWYYFCLNSIFTIFTWFVFWITGVIGDGRGLVSIGGWTINGGVAEWWTAATEFMTGAISTCWTWSPIKHTFRKNYSPQNIFFIIQFSYFQNKYGYNYSFVKSMILYHDKTQYSVLNHIIYKNWFIMQLINLKLPSLTRELCMLDVGTTVCAACLSGTRNELLLVGWLLGGVRGSNTDAIDESTVLSLGIVSRETIDCEVLLTESPGSVLTSTLLGCNRTPLNCLSWVIDELFESPSKINQLCC